MHVMRKLDDKPGTPEAKRPLLFVKPNSAVWSGASFVFVPKSTRIDEPLQAYFRLQAQGPGQFERTPITVDEDAGVLYA